MANETARQVRDLEDGFQKELSMANLRRILQLLPVVVVIGALMFIVSFIIGDEIAIRATLGGFTLSAALLFLVLRFVQPGDQVSVQPFHGLLVDIWNGILLLWGALMVGFAPNSVISYFDLAIAALMVGVVCVIPWRKLAAFYAATLLVIVVATPFLSRVESPVFLAVTSIILFLAFATYLASLFYSHAKEHYFMMQEWMAYQNNLEHIVVSGIRSVRSLEERMSLETVALLAEVLEYHDPYTKGHSENVARLAERIGAAMGYSLNEQKQLYWAGMLHDVGKTRVRAAILNKTGPLSDQEYAMVKKHPRYGWDMVKKSSVLESLQEIILYHHERMDGSGYPLGLRGQDIPEPAQIMAVADAWDAMRSERSYRQPLSIAEARQELVEHRNRQFSAVVVDAFLQMDESHR